MSGLRRTVSAALGAAVVVLAMVSPAVAATAATNITILSAGPDSSGDPYNLTVTASDTNPGVTQIASMTAHVFSASMQPVGNPIPMTYASGPATDQVWVATPAISIRTSIFTAMTKSALLPLLSTTWWRTSRKWPAFPWPSPKAI